MKLVVNLNSFLLYTIGFHQGPRCSATNGNRSRNIRVSCRCSTMCLIVEEYSVSIPAAAA